MSGRLKVLVVGQTPPPHHGQAIMIERLLRGEFARVQLFHVRMAFSDSIAEVGRFQIGKLLHLFSVVVKIFYFRIAHGVKILYYPPAGPNRVPLYRDLVILLCSRWMFRRTILHFHASGVSTLYPQLSRPMKWLVRRALFRADAAIRLAKCSPDDARVLEARREYIVPNGIEDESARFVHGQKRHREAKAEHSVVGTTNGSFRIADQETAVAISEALPIQILYVGILCESKGLLVLIEACGVLASRGVPFELEVVGQFQSPDFEAQVTQRIGELSLASHINFRGVLQGDAKWNAFAEAELLCLPTHYESETFPTVLLEAMSMSLPVAATRWRGIPEIVEDGKTGFLIEPYDAVGLADRLEQMQNDSSLRKKIGQAGRARFQADFTIEKFWRRMEEVFVETASV
jgi:glycosyltransferase involved in cell wall biosynthesis